MSSHSSYIDCKYNLDSNEAEIVCDWCQSMIDFNPREGWSVPLTPTDHERAIALFGGPSVHASGRWKRLAHSLGDGEHANWAKLEHEAMEPIADLPCSEAEFQELGDALVNGHELSNSQIRWLAQGIEFQDGSCFRIMDGRQYLDDVELPSIISLRSFFPIMTDKKLRSGWDLAKLIVGLSCSTPAANRNQDHREIRALNYVFANGDSNSRPMASMLAWLSTKVKIDRLKETGLSGKAGFISWAYDVRTELIRNGGRTNMQDLRKAFSNHPRGLFDCYDTPWMRHWRDPKEFKIPANTLDWPLRVSEKHISLRVRSQVGRTRLVQIPRQPVHLAILVSLALSPLNSDAGKILLGLQHNWSQAYLKTDAPTDQMVRSLEFCHGILNGLTDRVYVKNATVLVVGKLGHCYEINVTRGQHSAPYLISHLSGFGREHKDAICIHNGHYHSTVPLGDTMGSVVLSMYNDTTATLNIDSLNDLIRNRPPFGFLRPVPREWIAVLDQEALKELTYHHHNYVADPWYELRGRYEPEPERGNRGFRGLLQRQFRHGERISERRNTEWNEIFQEHFEESGTFPIHNVIQRWAGGVKPYRAHAVHRSSAEERAFRYGDFRRQIHHRRHAVMPRRRDDVHQIGDIRDGERRWCEVYSRIWSVLTSQPLGSDFLIPAKYGAALEFGNVDLKVTLRNTVERRFVRQIASILGYVKDLEGPNHTHYIRRDHPRPNARLRLTDLLGESQRRQGVRGAPPRWWNYANVERAPDTVERYPWQLHEDLTDEPRKQKEFTELTGLGDLFG